MSNIVGSVLPHIVITELETAREEQMDQLRSELSTIVDTYENIKSVSFDASYTSLISPFAYNHTDVLSGEDYVPIESETTSWWSGAKRVSDFQTDMLNANASKYEEIYVQQKQDKYERTIYMFDDKLTQHLIVVVFKMRGRHMISVNEVLMTLDEFLSITTGRVIEPVVRTSSTLYDKGSIECTTSQRTCIIPRTTMPLILLALTTLEKDYGHMFSSLSSD